MRVNFTELIGVNRVEWYFLRSVGWVFRHAGHPDIGIDAEVEETIGGEPTGKTIAIQIKSGLGNVAARAGGYVWNLQETRRAYFKNYNRPAILALYIPAEDRVIWAPITPEHMTPAGNSWNLFLPADRTLDATSAAHLSELIHGRAGTAKPVQRDQQQLIRDTHRLERSFYFADKILEGVKNGIGLMEFFPRAIAQTLKGDAESRREADTLLTTFTALAGAIRKQFDAFSEELGLALSAMVELLKLPMHSDVVSDGLRAAWITGAATNATALNELLANLRRLGADFQEMPELPELVAARSTWLDLIDRLTDGFADAQLLLKELSNVDGVS